MTSDLNDEINQFEDDYYDDEDDLGDFIADDDEEDDLNQKHKQHHQGDEDEEVEEEEEGEEEEEEEVEEAPVGQQEILSLREQLKANIRRKNAAMDVRAGKASCSSSMNHTMPQVKDKYGTFFGPSTAVLARRVIEEGCSSIMKELQNVPYRKGAHLVSKEQPGVIESVQKKPKFVSEEKRKADALRENRDYSSLFSNDADTQPPEKEQHDKVPAHAMKSNAQPARLSKDHGLKDAAPSVHARVHSKAASPGKDPHADRKRAIGPGRKGSSLPSTKKTSLGLQSCSNGQKLQQPIQNKRPQASIPGQWLQLQSQNQRPQSKGRPASLQGRRPDQGQLSAYNGSTEYHGRLKSAKKQLVPSSKLKASRSTVKCAVKRKSVDDEREMISSIIRKQFGYDPNKYADRDEDDRNMEVGFASIEMEERRSATLAKKEDDEQLRLIQEEETREREKRRKKVAQKKIVETT